ncbi:MAG TPA: type VI secretion system baseplate subunit TssG [Acidobacteriota bacterium]|nr:type VI secretion system baseplate subunit TssG [Acidobacteriota bacterium]
MGSETRASNLGLMQALTEKPYAFSFFQVVQLLQRYTGGARIGTAGPASDESLRLRPAVSLSFPAADILEIRKQDTPDRSRRRYHISTSFLGLCSSDSPLPTYYTEDLLWKETDQQAVINFLGIFHHRALSLLYRAWEKYRYGILFRHRGDDEYSQRIFALIGLGTDIMVRSSGIPSVRLLRYAGIYTHRPHCASTLAGMLRDYFALPGIGVEQCVERWVHIHPAQQNRLGGRNCTLGRDLNIGERVRDRRGKFRITMEPLRLVDFMRFLPVSEDYAAMVNLIRLYTTDRLDFDLQVKLKADEAPPLRLSSRSPLRLGWTTLMPGAQRDPTVVHRQPAVQSPQVAYSWAAPAAASSAGQENRGQK